MNLIKISTVSILLMLCGCATTNITQEEVPPNQPSSRKFSEYKYVFIKPLSITTELKEEHGNAEAVSSIDDELFNSLSKVFPNLNEFKSYDTSKTEKTLLIEPHVVKMKAVSTTTRALWGISAGSSAVILKVSYIDATTKKIIAEPSFYQHATAWAGVYGNTRHDQSMFSRISELVADYSSENY